jgi:hypothetical protein
MEIAAAVLRVLEEEARPLHSTVIQDLALRRGYLDPFEHPQLRRDLLGVLAQLAREGKAERIDKGIYAKPA